MCDDALDAWEKAKADNATSEADRAMIAVRLEEWLIQSEKAATWWLLDWYCINRKEHHVETSLAHVDAVY